MTDTPENIKQLQLKIWLSKPPMERLRQFLVDNGTLFQFWNEAKKSADTKKTSSVQAVLK
jgi:hypothetical protein